MLYCLLLCGVKPNASKLPGAEERDLSSIILSFRAKIIEKIVVWHAVVPF